MLMSYAIQGATDLRPRRASEMALAKGLNGLGRPHSAAGGREASGSWLGSRTGFRGWGRGECQTDGGPKLSFGAIASTLGEECGSWGGAGRRTCYRDHVPTAVGHFA